MSAAGSSGGGTPTGADFDQDAATHIGAPYEYGAAGPSAFDCSGLVQYSLGELGVGAPRTSEDQWSWVQQFHDAAQLAPGDLIFEQFPGDPDPSPGHVVIYAGGGQVIEAPSPGQDVRQRAWSPGEATQVGYGRVPGLSYGGQVTPGGQVNPSGSDTSTSGLFGSLTSGIAQLVITGPIILGGAALIAWGLARASGLNKTAAAAAGGMTP